MMVLVFSTVGPAAFAASTTFSAAGQARECFKAACVTHFPADAPFCKHIFVPNWTGAPVSALPITKDNQHLLQSGGPEAGADVLHPTPTTRALCVSANAGILLCHAPLPRETCSPPAAPLCRLVRL